MGNSRSKYLMLIDSLHERDPPFPGALNLSKTTRRLTAPANEFHGGDDSIRDDDARGCLLAL
jgi:hypothetical protein